MQQVEESPQRRVAREGVSVQHRDKCRNISCQSCQ